MKIKLRLFFFTTFFPFLINAQTNGRVVYNATWKVCNTILEGKGILYFNLKQACFLPQSNFTLLNKPKPVEEVAEDNEEGTVTKMHINRSNESDYSLTINDPFNIYYNRDSLKLYQFIVSEGLKEFDLNSDVMLWESVGKIDWEIEADTISIGKHLCQKAICKFRGRTYIAWFTIEIPVPYGPWKLNGLPGLILKAEDINKEILFIAEVIEISNTIEPEKNVYMQPTEQILFLGQYIDYRRVRNNEIDEKIKNRLQVLESRAPKDAVIWTTFKPSKECGIQLEYEF